MRKTWFVTQYRNREFIATDILKFHNNQCPDYFDKLFCPVNRVIIRPSSNKKLKLPFCKSKLWIQSLSHVGPNTWNSLPGNLKSATCVNSLSIILKNILKNQVKVEVDISLFSWFQYQYSFQFFLCVIIYFINFNISFFLRDHLGNKALHLFCTIAVVIVFFIYSYLPYIDIFQYFLYMETK